MDRQVAAQNQAATDEQAKRYKEEYEKYEQELKKQQAELVFLLFVLKFYLLHILVIKKSIKIHQHYMMRKL